jgi:hypothetical protein
LKIDCQNPPFPTAVSFSHYDRINSVSVSLGTSASKNPSAIPLQFLPPFQRFSLFLHPSVTELPFYPHLQQISLANCDELQTLNSIRHIPYITIHDCQEVEDFSCLGAFQRYLAISFCSSLKDIDLNQFGNISFLSISLCMNITMIPKKVLVNCRLLTFSSLGNLRKAHLSGVSYVKVKFRRCSQLSRVKVTGRVQLLTVHDFKKYDSEQF